MVGYKTQHLEANILAVLNALWDARPALFKQSSPLGMEGVFCSTLCDVMMYSVMWGCTVWNYTAQSGISLQKEWCCTVRSGASLLMVRVAAWMMTQAEYHNTTRKIACWGVTSNSARFWMLSFGICASGCDVLRWMFSFSFRWYLLLLNCAELSRVRLFVFLALP